MGIVSEFWRMLFGFFFLPLCIGGSSKSSSSSTTNNYDKRNAVQDGIGLSGDGSSVTVTNNITDAGIVSRALDSLDLGNANNAQGFGKLLDASGELLGTITSSQASGFDKLIGVAADMWNQGQNLIGTTQKSVADAYSTAQSDKAGAIDNRTLIVLAVAAAAALAFMNRKG